MWPRSVTTFGRVVIGIAIGSGVVGLMVAWTNEGFYMTIPTQMIRPGKKKKKLDIVSLNVAIMYMCSDYAYNIAYFLRKKLNSSVLLQT